MSAESTTTMTGRALAAIWDGSGDLDALFADSFEFRSFSGADDITDLAGLRRRIARVCSAHPRGRLRVKDVIGAGELVAVQWAFEDRSRQSEPAHGKTQAAVLDGMSLFRLEEGRVVEIWELNGQLAREPVA